MRLRIRNKEQREKIKYLKKQIREIERQGKKSKTEITADHVKDKKKQKKKPLMNKLLVNIMDEKDVIDEFEVDYPCKSFIHPESKKEYRIVNKQIYLKYHKNTYQPYLFFNENNNQPVDFRNRNKGIPARALKLLWNSNMYSILFTPESDKLNKILIILLIINLGLYGVVLYLRYGQ